MKRCFLCRLRFKDWRQTLEDGSVFLQSYSFYSFTKFSACFCRKHGWNYWFENLVNGCFWFPTYYSICLFWFETRHKRKANILLISHGKDGKDFFIWFAMRFTIWGQKNHRSDDDKELATDLLKNLLQKLSA